MNLPLMRVNGAKRLQLLKVVIESLLLCVVGFILVRFWEE